MVYGEPITKELRLNQAYRKQELANLMTDVRNRTLQLLEIVPDKLMNLRFHDFYSPVGWHFGHIGMTEEYWTVVRAMGKPPRDKWLSHLFANIPENPKENRVNLPDKIELASYLSSTRDRALELLIACDLEMSEALVNNGYAWMFAIQHECQHQETILELLQLAHRSTNCINSTKMQNNSLASDNPVENKFVNIPGGVFEMGYNGFESYDNEQLAHPVEVMGFELQEFSVSVGEWRTFMQDGGYRNSKFWSSEGWNWVQTENVHAPFYWQAGEDGVAEYAPLGLRNLYDNLPVCSVSWFEANAYVKWAGFRLPTEAEWEYGAAYNPEFSETRKFAWGNTEPSLKDADFGSNSGPSTIRVNRPLNQPFGVKGLNGGVWEWTSSLFLPYNGFKAYPYDGYSLEHMDGDHFVCKGGSWASAAMVLRSSFRNWYIPGYRQGFLGLRCAK